MRIHIVGLLASLSVLFALPSRCGAEDVARYDWQRLAGVSRIAYINPDFVRNQRADKDTGPDVEYRKILTDLRATLQEAMQRRLAGQTRFHCSSTAEVQRAMRSLRWISSNLFEANAARSAKGRFRPEGRRIMTLARKLNVDAVLVGVMFEPASIGDSVNLRHSNWDINPLNVGVHRIKTHVISPRVQAYLISADGRLLWQDEQMADHPRSKPRSMHTLKIDWIEATQQVADQLADSLLRLPPATELRGRETIKRN